MNDKNRDYYKLMDQAEKTERGLDLLHIGNTIKKLREKVQKLTQGKSAVWKTTENLRTNG